jgi:predicted small secreted protein
MFRKLKFVQAMVLLACLVLAGCKGKTLQPKGELMLAITTDMKVPQDFDTIHIRVLTNDTVRFSDDLQVGSGHLLLPATLGIVAGSDPTEPVTIRVSSTQNGTARTFR